MGRLKNRLYFVSKNITEVIQQWAILQLNPITLGLNQKQKRKKIIAFDMATSHTQKKKMESGRLSRNGSYFHAPAWQHPAC